MNQLIECRKSPANIWTEQCEDRIRNLIDQCQFLKTNIEFTPSDHVFMMELRRDFNVSQEKYIHILLDILSSSSGGRESSVYRDVFVCEGLRVYFCFLNESLSFFDFDWNTTPGFSIKTVRMSWYQEGYTVTNINTI